MCWEPLAEWGPLDSDFGDLSPPPTKVLAISGNSEHFSFKRKITPQTLCFTEPYDNPF